MPRCDLEERFPDFSKTDNNNILLGFHELLASCAKIAARNSSIVLL
jgi:hypothetical protein